MTLLRIVSEWTMFAGALLVLGKMAEGVLVSMILFNQLVTCHWTYDYGPELVFSVSVLVVAASVYMDVATPASGAYLAVLFANT